MLTNVKVYNMLFDREIIRFIVLSLDIWNVLSHVTSFSSLFIHSFQHN